ncbi:MAG: DUF1565 domain-containing protein [bacterium]|nr:DUF1565 domain-containing protein [bacterium]
MNWLKCLLLMGLITAIGCSSDDSTSSDECTISSTVYVNASSSASSPDGSSWDSAYTELSDGLSAACSGAEVWVAQGTYYPTSDSDRTASFTLVSGVSVYGGFDGTESVLSGRDYETNITTLSGDIDKDNISDDENSYHVVTGTDNAVLDGFTIEMGYASLSAGSSPPSDFDAENSIEVESGYENDTILRILTGVNYIAGGGMLNLQAAPTVKNCTFQNNYASKGGAVYNMVQRYYPATSPDDYDSPYFENVIFQYNTGSGRGGAVNNDFCTDPTFVNSQFLYNTGEDKGGAVYSDLGCDATFVNVLFARNEADRGTALVSDGSSNPILIWVTMVDNEATDIGASLYQGTYGADTQSDGRESGSNDPKVNYSLIMGNSSGASGSSISSWLDCSVLTDGNSIIEETDGTYTLDTYFTDADNEDYSPTGSYSSLGWDPDRDYSNWADYVDAVSSRTYEAFPYTTSSSTATTDSFYVDASAASSGSGGSWGTAFKTLQEALAETGNGDTVYVAQGTYYPTTDSNRETAFVIPEGVTLVGGYQTGGAAGPAPATYETILSGDIDGDDSSSALGDSDNSYHVVVGSSDSSISGFTIKHGYANGDWYHQRGAGMLNYDGASPAVKNCTFEYNYAIEGAAMANYNYASPTITGCTFENNSALRGGAVLFRTGADAAVNNSTFSSNTASDRGGAVFIDYGACPAFGASTGCTFSSNSSGGNGGAVYVDDNASQIGETTPEFHNSAFSSNSASGDYGGAIFGYNSSTEITISSCTFSSNTSATAGADMGFRLNVEVTISGSTYSSTVYSDSSCTITE